MTLETEMSDSEISEWNLTKDRISQNPGLGLAEVQFFERVDKSTEELLHNMERMFKIIKHLDRELENERAKLVENEEKQKKMMVFCETRFPEVWELGQVYGWKQE